MNVLDIQERDHSLFCKTTYENCCRSLKNGDWIYPNDENAVSLSSNDSQPFYRTRRAQTVLLHRNKNQNYVNGIFECKIVYINNTTKRIYAGIYSNSTGK